MKPSHFTAPRTSAQCIWCLDADPIERPEHTHHSHLGLALAVGALLILAAIVLATLGTHS